MYRTSLDIQPVYGSVMTNLFAVVPLANANLSVPGSWAYPDMLEVGVTVSPVNAPLLTYAESRTHFNAWCVVSSPLILGLNVTDAATVESVWDIIANTEAIGVNQLYAGFSGSLLLESNSTATIAPCGWALTCEFASWSIWYKPLPGGAVALLLINNAASPQALSVQWEDVPGLSAGGNYTVRDINAHADLGYFPKGFITPAPLASHDNAFIIVNGPGGGKALSRQGWV